MEGSHLQARHGKDSSMRVARSGAVLGIFSTRGSAQAVRRRRYQLCDHEAGANSARIRVRSSLCRRRVQVGDSSTATPRAERNGVQPEAIVITSKSPTFDARDSGLVVAVSALLAADRNRNAFVLVLAADQGEGNSPRSLSKASNCRPTPSVAEEG